MSYRINQKIQRSYNAKDNTICSLCNDKTCCPTVTFDRETYVHIEQDDGYFRTNYITIGKKCLTEVLEALKKEPPHDSI